MEALELINGIRNDLYTLKRKYSDNPGRDNETLKLLSKSIGDIESLEKTLIHNLFEALKRKYSDNPGRDNETLKLLSKSIGDIESLEKTLIHNLFELKQRLKQEIVADQIYLVFTKSNEEKSEIRNNLNEAIAQLNNLDRLVEDL